MNHVIGVEMIYHSDFLIQNYLFKSDKSSSEAVSNEFERFRVLFIVELQ